MKIILFILTFTLATNWAAAQNNHSKTKGGTKPAGQKAKATPEERAEKATNRLKTELGLSDEQTPKVKELTLARVNAVADAKTKYGADKKGFMTERKKIHQNWEEQMKAVLTADQFQKYQTKKEEKKKQLKEKREKAKTGKPDTEEIEELEEEVGE